MKDEKQLAWVLFFALGRQHQDRVLLCLLKFELCGYGELICHGVARLAAGGGLAFAGSEFDRGYPSNGFARLGLAQPGA
jgi:hypothetical protein